MADAVADLLRFIDASPTPFHAAAEAAARLSKAGFRELRAEDAWEIAPGDARYVIRGGGLVAFVAGSAPPAAAGLRWAGAHTDSPSLRVKPRPDVSAHGCSQLAVEPYGGLLLHTWLDRDLSLAGRVSVAGPRGPQTFPLAFDRPLLRIPSLAIHLQRESERKTLELNAQQHLAPIVGLGGAPPLAALIAAELRAKGLAEIEPHDVLAFDLMAHDAAPACLVGTDRELISAPRLDNLSSCHAAVSALARVSSQAGRSPRTCGIVLYDHEEVGSRSAQGAAGPLLGETIGRIVEALGDGGPQARARALARSRFLSVDVAHALHPNYADRHEPGHRPLLGKGPVLKINAAQSYATDGEVVAELAALFRTLGAEPQYFVARSDLGCGSTVGPITAARVGIRTADVGNPVLAMHSCRELAAAADVEPMIGLLSAFLEA